MDLIILVLQLAGIGVAVWAIITLIPMPQSFKTAIYIVAAIAVLSFLIRRFSGAIPNILP